MDTINNGRKPILDRQISFMLKGVDEYLLFYTDSSKMKEDLIFDILTFLGNNLDRMYLQNILSDTEIMGNIYLPEVQPYPIPHMPTLSDKVNFIIRIMYNFNLKFYYDFDADPLDKISKRSRFIEFIRFYKTIQALLEDSKKTLRAF